MTTRLDERRRQLRAEYGFDFPDDLFRFWEFANRLRPLEPLQALAEPLEIHLVGPFDVLAGRFDGRTPRHGPRLHWRYYNDPPEFFTVLAGGSDGLHWGYYLDDPDAGPGCVASYYARDAFELSTDGDDLFQAVRLALEEAYRDCRDYLDEDAENARHYRSELHRLDRLREALCRYGTHDRPETDEEYVEKYQGLAARNARVVAATHEGMGVVVPAERYRPPALADEPLWEYLWDEDDPAGLVEEGRRALREGFPGTALKLGKDLWATDGGGPKSGYAAELLDAAYRDLGREPLRHVLAEHFANRNLPSVDVLDEEAWTGNGAAEE